MEDPWLNAFVLNPGLVSTEGVSDVAGSLGLDLESMDRPDDVARGLLKVLSDATKERVGGKIVSYTGKIEAW